VHHAVHARLGSCTDKLVRCKDEFNLRMCRCVTLAEAPPYLRRNFILTGYYIGVQTLSLSCCLLA